MHRGDGPEGGRRPRTNDARLPSLSPRRPDGLGSARRRGSRGRARAPYPPPRSRAVPRWLAWGRSSGPSACALEWLPRARTPPDEQPHGLGAEPPSAERRVVDRDADLERPGREPTTRRDVRLDLPDLPALDLDREIHGSFLHDPRALESRDQRLSLRHDGLNRGIRLQPDRPRALELVHAKRPDGDSSPWSRGRSTSGWYVGRRPRSSFSAPGGSRTPNLLIRRYILRARRAYRIVPDQALSCLAVPGCSDMLSISVH